MTKKCHNWSPSDEEALLVAVEECKPLFEHYKNQSIAYFEHYKNQSIAYNELNAWDAIAGRLLPGICVTGAACKRRFEKMREREREPERDGWAETAMMVSNYEKELAETTFDGVAELLGNFDALFDAVIKIKGDIDELKKAWQ